MKALVHFLLLCGLSFHLFAQTPKYLVANGEYANFILDNSTQTLYGIGQGAVGVGSNTGQVGLPIPCQFPVANTKIKFAAAGLHTATAVDLAGNVYFTGPNEDGSMGIGSTDATIKANSFVQIPTDNLGNPFTNVKYLNMTSAIFTGGTGYGALIFAIKDDGTLWTWGNTQGGYAGNGTYGQVYSRPTQITAFPAGTQITKVFSGNIVIALDANGNVWTWGGNNNASLLGNSSQTDYETPHMISLPSKAIDIAGGGFFSYALLDNHSLYGWGWYTGYMGIGTAAGSGVVGLSPPNKPMLLDTSLNLPAKIAKISTNNSSTYVILTDGTLWAWGGNECGQIGNGQELDYTRYTNNPAPYGGSSPQPYNWNQDNSTAQLQQHKPVNIAPGMNNFVSLSEGTAAVWYKFAIDANNQLYSWGRSKSGILANGIMEGNYVNGGIIATYPNALDVPYVTAIDPFAAGAKTIQSTCPWCLLHPTATSCNLYAVPANTKPNSLINGGKNGSTTVTTTNTSLDGTASSDDVYISYYVWSQVSGPNTPIISIPSGKKVNILGLTTGTYVFKLRVTDNGWMSDSTTFTLNVNTSGPQPPVANAGTNQIITLPTNSVTLTGSGSELNGTIVGYAWSQTAGPTTATVATPGQAQTGVSNLAEGIYRFQLTVTDNSGVTATASVQVTVNPALPVPGPPSANAGSDQNITLPASSVTLTGSGSETNGTIVGYAWSQTGGPTTATISTPGQAQTGVSSLAQGVYTFQLKVTDNSGVTATDVVTVTVNPAIPVPGAPSANAGSNQIITLPPNSVTLTGSGSETNGTIVGYAWLQTGGPTTATIGTPGQAQTSVSNMVQGVYRFQLTVTDNSGVTATASVQVTVNAAPVVPGPPSANAGSDQNITLPTSSVTLTGSGSESNGTIVGYTWSQTGGPTTATIATPGQAQTSVSNLAQGVYTFQLKVTDNSGVTATDVVTVTVKAAPVVPGAPSANAGSDQNITLPANSVTLTGSGSETNGSIVGFAWSQTGGPTTATIATPGQAQTGVSNLAEGVYTFQLKVTDNSGVTATDVVTVTVNAAAATPNVAPVAIAGPDQAVDLPVTVTLDGSASYDPDGSIVKYSWMQVSGLGGVSITSSATAKATVYGLQPGVYVFRLMVTDNDGATGTSEVTITVSAGNLTLFANAGVTDTVALPVTEAILNGSLSSTSTGTIVSYTWEQESGPQTAILTSPDSVYTLATGLIAGNYVFKLTVKDDSGNEASADVTIVVLGNNQRYVEDIKLYPNPAHDVLNFQYQSDKNEKISVFIFDVKGSRVLAANYEKENTSLSSSLNISGLGRGVYYFEIIDATGKKTARMFVKQ